MSLQPALSAIIVNCSAEKENFVLFVKVTPLGNLKVVLSSRGLADISHQTGLMKDNSLWGVSGFLLQVDLAGPVVVHRQKVFHSKKHLDVFVESSP